MVQGAQFKRSFWDIQSAREFTHPILTSNTRADVAIVGGGFSGLSCGIALAKAGANTALLELLEQVN